jgi:hypothetical protein
MTAIRCLEEEMIEKYQWYFHYVVGDSSGRVNAHTHGVADHFGHMDLQITLPIAQARIQGVFNAVMDRIKSGGRQGAGQVLHNRAGWHLAQPQPAVRSGHPRQRHDHGDQGEQAADAQEYSGRGSPAPCRLSSWL